MLIEPQGLKSRVFAPDRLFFYCEKFGALPDPPANDLLVFGVVVIGGEMSPKIGASVSDFLAGEHLRSQPCGGPWRGSDFGMTDSRFVSRLAVWAGVVAQPRPRGDRRRQE